MPGLIYRFFSQNYLHMRTGLLRLGVWRSAYAGPRSLPRVRTVLNSLDSLNSLVLVEKNKKEIKKEENKKNNEKGSDTKGKKEKKKGVTKKKTKKGATKKNTKKRMPNTAEKKAAMGRKKSRFGLSWSYVLVSWLSLLMLSWHTMTASWMIDTWRRLLPHKPPFGITLGMNLFHGTLKWNFSIAPMYSLELQGYKCTARVTAWLGRRCMVAPGYVAGRYWCCRRWCPVYVLCCFT